ncbi:MAG: hypothetical protein H7066_07895 [Cytophagaceae bacterium]|nr:hypothetical protein [Gemmatimonadaceae bacterium]
MAATPLAPPHPPVAASADARRAETLNVLCLAATIVIAAFMAWITRDAVNPDGVAYLDLARAVRDGKWSAFVQGYWSPLYPLVLAVVGATIATAHLANGALAIAGGWLLSRTLRRYLTAVPDDGGHVVRVSAAWCTYVVAAFVLVRISAITPDMALLLCLVGWAGELTNPRGVRWMAAGAWLGVGFLAKTSLWPWMLVGTVVVAWGHPALRSRAAVVRYLVPMLVGVLAWLVPLSVREGRPTLGVTGALNACWFLRECDGQSPDVHLGSHVAYEEVVLPRGEAVTRVRFPDATWTYAPWSDPDGWSRGVRSQSSEPLTVGRYAGIVWKNLRSAVLFSLSYLLLGPALVLLAWGLLARVPLRPLARWTNAALLLAGLAGIAQFVAVQAVTRTLAPFVLACGVAITLGARPAAGRRAVAGTWRVVLTTLPLVIALVATARVVRYEWQLAALSDPYRDEMRTLSERASDGFKARTVMAVGPGIVLMPLAAQLGARIVSQVPTRHVSQLDVLSPADRRAALIELADSTADVAWEVDRRGRSRVTGLR